MKLKPRKRLRFRKIYRGPIIRITIDVRPFVRAMQQMVQAMARLAGPLGAALEQWHQQLQQAQRSTSTAAVAR